MTILNKSGLKKLMEHLEVEYPGISKKLVIENNRLMVKGADVVLIAELLDTIPPPPGARPMPGKRPSTDPAMQKAPAKPATIIGKAPDSEVRAIGRAGTMKAEKEKEAQQVQDLQKFFPTTDKLQQALKSVVDNLGA